MNSINALHVSADEIIQNLPIYLQRVQAGETFIIVTADEPLAEIRPVKLSRKFLRPIGLCAGEFMVPDDFDAPLSNCEFRAG